MKGFSKHLPAPESLVLPAIVVLVGLSAFGLGRLSVVVGESPATPLNVSPPVASTTGVYVASKSGNKYYLPGCPGVANIKDSNKVWFATAAQAQAAGYTKATNCPGL